MKSLKSNQKLHVLMFWSLPSISMIDAYKEKCRKLNQAICKTKSVEIVTNQDDVLQLNKLGVESGRFYGFENFKGEIKEILLNLNEIKMIILL